MVAIAAAVLVSACAPGQLSVGPLGARPENQIVEGQPVQRGRADTITADVMYNGGRYPAVIDRLVLVSPRHIDLVGAYICPAARGLVGNWAAFPPFFGNDRQRAQIRGIIWAWAHRQEAVGAVIPPHQWAGITLGLEATAAQGSIARIDLFYNIGGVHYEYRGRTRIILTRVRKLARGL